MFQSISKFLIGNRFHVTLRIVSPTTLFKQNLYLNNNAKRRSNHQSMVLDECVFCVLFAYVTSFFYKSNFCIMLDIATALLATKSFYSCIS